MRSTNLDKELQSAIRETRVIANLIKSGCTCITCFVANPFLIEEHHVGGRKNSSLKVPLCANCHLLASKNQLSYGQNWLEGGKTEPERARYVIGDLKFLIRRLERNYGIN